jgi:hypothetical protein
MPSINTAQTRRERIPIHTSRPGWRKEDSPTGWGAGGGGDTNSQNGGRVQMISKRILRSMFNSYVTVWRGDDVLQNGGHLQMRSKNT